MNKIIGKIKKEILTLNTLEKKVLWCSAPCFSLGLAMCGIVNAIQGFKPIQIIACFVFALPPFLLLYLGAKNDDYETNYILFALYCSCVAIPIILMINGGIRSGMPIMCMIVIAMPAAIQNKRKRIIATTLTFIVNLFVFLLAIEFEELTIPLNGGDEAFKIDVLVSYLIGGAAFVMFISMFVDELQKYTASKRLLNYYMDQSVQEVIYDNSNKIKEPNIGTYCTATILFADISAFSSLTQLMKPEEESEYLNTFFRIADKCILENGGILDKYLGDAFMAYWVDRNHQGDGIDNACRTVLQIQREIHAMAEEIHKKFHCDISFSAGINYGDVMIGPIGSDRRKEYTIIGDPVNIAQSLQGYATKGKYLVTQKVYELASANIILQKSENPILFKGKSKAMDVYELKDVEDGFVRKDKTRILNVEKNKGYMMTFCGCRGSYAVSGAVFTEFGGETSCYVLKKDDYALIVDCGTGLYKARDLLQGCRKIDVLLTHVHYDHILGLLDWSIFPKDAQLRFFGNFAQWEGNDTINNFLRAPFWPVNLSNGEINNIEKDVTFALNDEISVTFYQSSHPNFGCVINLNINGTRVFIMADIEDPDIIPTDAIRNTDVLIFDGMYEQKDYSKHVGWGHSTWERGVRLALEEKCGQLIVTHHNPANTDTTLSELEKRAIAIFPRTRFAREGDKLYI